MGGGCLIIIVWSLSFFLVVFSLNDPFLRKIYYQKTPSFELLFEHPCHFQSWVPLPINPYAPGVWVPDIRWVQEEATKTNRDGLRLAIADNIESKGYKAYKAHAIWHKNIYLLLCINSPWLMKWGAIFVHLQNRPCLNGFELCLYVEWARSFVHVHCNVV